MTVRKMRTEEVAATFAQMRDLDAANAPDLTEPDNGVLLTMLADRLVREFPLSVWEKTFLGAGFESIRFHHAVQVFVCTTELTSLWTDAQLEKLVRSFHGCVEARGDRPSFSFEEPNHALQLALFLQGAAQGRLRAAIVTLPCTVASFDVSGQAWRLAVTPAADAAAALVDIASPACILVSGETYPVLASQIEKHAGGLVTTEMDGDVVTCVEITFSRPAQPDASTFVGLGLT